MRSCQSREGRDCGLFFPDGDSGAFPREQAGVLDGRGNGRPITCSMRPKRCVKVKVQILVISRRLGEINFARCVVLRTGASTT
jgi:hypothetical protein